MQLYHSKGAQFKNSNIQIILYMKGLDQKSINVILKLKYPILLKQEEEVLTKYVMYKWVRST